MHILVMFIKSEVVFVPSLCNVVLIKWRKSYALAIFSDVDSWSVVSIFDIVHEAPHAARHNVQPYRIGLHVWR